MTQLMRKLGGDLAQVAVYQGEDLLCMGTIRSCAKELGIQANSLYYYLMPAYERKLAKKKRSDNSKVRRVVLI